MKKPLAKKQKEGVREWLKAKEYDACPFEIIFKNCLICQSWFPRIKGHDSQCPCTAYSLHTVIERAREMVRGEVKP